MMPRELIFSRKLLRTWAIIVEHQTKKRARGKTLTIGKEIVAIQYTEYRSITSIVQLVRMNAMPLQNMFADKADEA